MNRSRITGDLAAHGILFADIANDRVGIGSTIPGNKLSLPDSAKIGLGNAEDLTLYHDSGHSYINNALGDLVLKTTNDDIVLEAYDDISMYVQGASGSGAEKAIMAIGNGAVELYHNNSKKLETTSTGIQVGNYSGNPTITLAATQSGPSRLNFFDNNATEGVTLRAEGATAGGQLVFCNQWSGETARAVFDAGTNPNFTLYDSVKLQLGTDADIALYHNGTDAYIDNDTGGLRINTASDEVQINKATNEYMARFITDGAVELYHNNSKKFETSSTGATLTGVLTTTQLNVTNGLVANLSTNGYDIKFGDSTSGIGFRNRARFGAGEDMTIFHSGTHSYVQHSGTGNLYIDGSTDDLVLQAGDDVRILTQSNENAINCIGDGAVELYHNANKKFETTSSGVSVTGVAALSSSTHEKITLSGSTDPLIRFQEGTTNKAFISWHSGGYIRLQNQEDASILKIQDDIVFSMDDGSTYHKVWHAGNDGSGTGLDADLLDGVQGASYLRSDATDTASGGVTFTSSALTLSGHWYSRFYNGTKNYIHLYPGGHSGNASSTDIRAFNGTDADVFQINGGSATGLKWRGNTIWTAENDGASSGLDADLLDGVQGASYLRSDANDTMSGSLSLTSSSQYPLTINSSDDGKIVLQGSNSPYIRFQEGTTNKAYIQWSSSGYFQLRNQEDGSGIRIQDDLRFTTDNFSSTNHKIWHAGNDGSGSGLDADTLQGSPKSSFPLLSGSNSFTNSYNEFGNSTGSVSNNGNWNARLNLAGSSHARLDVVSVSDSITTSLYSHTGHAAGRVGTLSNHKLILMCNGSNRAELSTSGSLSTTVQGTLWGASNDGAGSGLDADTVDGFATSQSGGANKIAVIGSNGYLYVDDWIRVGNNDGLYCSDGQHLYTGGNGSWKSWLNRSDHSTACGIGMESSDGTDRGWVYADTAHVGLLNPGGTWLFKCPIGNTDNPLTGSGYTIWHSNNDGSGSGLDADTLDGIDSGGFVRHNNNTNYILRFGSGGNTGHTPSSYAYAIFQESGAWSSGGGTDGYPDLRINYHTGIVLAAHQNYGGVRIHRDYNDTTELMSIGKSDNHVRIANNLYVSGGDLSLGVAAPGGTFGGKYAAFAIGDDDTGICQDGDGQLELWANDQEIINCNTGQVTIKKVTLIQNSIGVGVLPGTSGNPFNNRTYKIAIGDNDTGLAQISDGVLGIYGNGQLRAKTTNEGLTIMGIESGGAVLGLEADEGDDNQDKWEIRAATNNELHVKHYYSGSWKSGFHVLNNGQGDVPTFRGPQGGIRYDVNWANPNSSQWGSFGGDGMAHRVNGQAYHTADDHFRIRKNGSAENRRFDLRTDTGHGEATNNWNSNQFDFAEFFEWSDGNPSAEDRIGNTVAVDGLTGKIKIAEEGDTVIGVVSGTAAFVGNAGSMTWHGAYLRDEWGRFRLELVKDENGNQLYSDPQEGSVQPKVNLMPNPDWDESIPYHRREDRKEWDAIGIIGQCYVRKTAVIPSSWIKLKEIDSVKDFYLIK